MKILASVWLFFSGVVLPTADVGTGITVSSTPHTELQPVPPGEVDGDGHVLRGGRPHDHPRPADAGPVVDRPQLVVPRSAAGDDLAEDQVS